MDVALLMKCGLRKMKLTKLGLIIGLTDMETMKLKDMLAQQVENWGRLGHPDLMARFVLRNGKAFVPRKRIGPKRAAKQCFANATRFVFDHGGTYVEGYTLMRDLPIMPIHHAWVTMTGDDVMDPTLDVKTHEYFGVAFDTETLKRESRRNGVYGLLDTGLGLNAEFMFKVDPELKAIVEAVEPSAKFRKLEETNGR